MTGAELRASVLQAAVQGRLVPQDPSDEPASALLERVRGERRELVKARKAKAPKGGESVIERYEDGSVWERRGSGPAVDITDEVPFDIPEGWEWVRAGDFGDWQAGATPAKGRSDYYRDGTIPWLLTGDLNDGHISNVPRMITDKALHECSVRLNPIGSVLVAMYGATIGKTAILDIESTTNQACCACIPYLIETNEWLFTWLKSNKQTFIDMGAGGAQPNISRTKIVACLIPVPPLAEQQRIVAKLDKLMPLIERYDRLDRERAELNAGIEGDMRASVLQVAVQGRLVPQDPSDEPASVLLERIRQERRELVRQKKAKAPKGGESVIERYEDGSVWERRGCGPAVEITDEVPFDVPENWEWARLESICGHIVDGDHNPPKNSGSGVPILSAANVHGNSLHLEEANRWITREQYKKAFERIRPSVGCVLMTIVGTIGRTAVLDVEEPFALQRSVAIFRPLLMNSWYVASFLSSQAQYLNSISSGTAQKGVYLGAISTLLIPVPPLAEQKRIVAKLDELMPMVEQLGKAATR